MWRFLHSRFLASIVKNIILIHALKSHLKLFKCIHDLKKNKHKEFHRKATNTNELMIQLGVIQFSSFLTAELTKKLGVYANIK